MDDIRRLVDGFYSRVREDELLAPIFSARITRWQPHLEVMYTFWQTMLLGQVTYQGQPFPKHASLPIDARHFDRWILLFHQTIDEYFTGRIADEAKVRSSRIADVFRYKMNLMP